MQRHIYTFKAPRTADGSVDFKKLVNAFLDAELAPVGWLNIARAVDQYIAAGDQDVTELTDGDLAALQLGVTLQMQASPAIIGNPVLAAEAADEYLDRQFNETDLLEKPEHISMEEYTKVATELRDKMDAFVALCGGTWQTVNMSVDQAVATA